MTIQTPTSNPAGADAPLAGLPDIAVLNKLAGEFFAALPTGARGVPAGAQ
ncbi:MAG: hypothetical protein H7Z39_16575, partial [Burkholderiaceae bacterium]|nr:hypothetical protein [Burkholderiaceae bacterium]